MTLVITNDLGLSILPDGDECQTSLIDVLSVIDALSTLEHWDKVINGGL